MPNPKNTIDFLLGEINATVNLIRADQLSIKIDVNELKEGEAARRGGLKVFIAMFSVLGTVTGWAGSYIHELWSKS